MERSPGTSRGTACYNENWLMEVMIVTSLGLDVGTSVPTSTVFGSEGRKPCQCHVCWTTASSQAEDSAEH